MGCCINPFTLGDGVVGCHISPFMLGEGVMGCCINPFMLGEDVIMQDILMSVVCQGHLTLCVKESIVHVGCGAFNLLHKGGCCPCGVWGI